MTDEPQLIPTTEDQPDGPTSSERIAQVLHGLRTRQTGHLAAAISLIEALQQERDRRRTALNVLGVVVSLLVEDDQTKPPARAMDPMRRKLLESALERAVLALYPESVTEAIQRAEEAPDEV